MAIPVFFILWFIWNIGMIWQATMGYGQDTDAWLMAQTAWKLRLGLPYDPARSLGNPVYEFALAFLQPEGKWLISNLFNLLLANFFLFRAPSYFPFLSGNQAFAFRLLLMTFPVFAEAASSSMEYMPALVLFFECIHFTEKRKFTIAFILLIFSSFIRLEFFVFLSLVWLPSTQFKSIFMLGWLVLLSGFSLYVGWAIPLNPSPFSEATSLLRFYGGRIYFLAMQAGLLLPFFLLPFFFFFRFRKQPSPPNWFINNLLFFIFFPFEWAYFLPAFVFSLAQFTGLLAPRLSYFLLFPGLLFGLSFCDLWSWKLAEPNFYRQRKENLAWYIWANSEKPQKPTLLLFGATYIPAKVSDWDKVLDNRVFQKKGSLLFVGEKLRPEELRLFKEKGFQLLKQKKGFSGGENSEPDIEEISIPIEKWAAEGQRQSFDW